jgi:hypothetical protein
MKVRQVGFQEAVAIIEPYVGSAIAAQAKRPVIKQVQEIPTENPPFRSTYEKYFKPHAWLAQRGLKEETLQRFGVGYYEKRNAWNAAS